MVGFRLLTGDSLEVLPSLLPQRVDVVFTDPPYNVSSYGRKVSREGGTDLGPDYAWDAFSNDRDYEAFTNSWMLWASKLLRPGGHFVSFCGHKYFSIFVRMGESYGLRYRDMLVWARSNPPPRFMKRDFMRGIDILVWMTKDPVSEAHFSFPGGTQRKNYIVHPVISGKERMLGEDGKILNKTQKPEKVIEHFLAPMVRLGDTVLDPFCGVGSILKVALDLGCNVIGIDSDPVYVEAARKRLLACHYKEVS